MQLARLWWGEAVAEEVNACAGARLAQRQQGKGDTGGWRGERRGVAWRVTAVPLRYCHVWQAHGCKGEKKGTMEVGRGWYDTTRHGLGEKLSFGTVGHVWHGTAWAKNGRLARWAMHGMAHLARLA